jgi:hypothetical protein
MSPAKKGGSKMPRFKIEDLQTLESFPSSPGSLRSKLAEMIINSTACRASVQSIDKQTGEYRVVLQGTLDKEEAKWEG